MIQQSSLDVPSFTDIQADHLHKVDYVQLIALYLLLKQAICWHATYENAICVLAHVLS